MYTAFFRSIYFSNLTPIYIILHLTKAFVKAWNDVCGTTQGTPTLIIPEGKTFLLQPLSFQGPCKSTTIQVEVICFEKN